MKHCELRDIRAKLHLFSLYWSCETGECNMIHFPNIYLVTMHRDGVIYSRRYIVSLDCDGTSVTVCRYKSCVNC
jgi:hypothetical protein